MSITALIHKKLRTNQEQLRKHKYLVLSEPAYSALRRETVGLDKAIAQPREEIAEYWGMKVIVLDRDDILVEVG